MRTIHFSALMFSSALAAFAGCGGDGERERVSGDGAGAGGGTGGGLIGGVGGGITITGEPWPAEPIIEADAPENVVALFEGVTPSGTGPCVHEPQSGAMVPRNWLRPRFRLASAAGETVFQIRLSSDLMEHDLVAYTGSDVWGMPKEYWGGIAQLAVSQTTVNVTIRATTPSGGEVSESTVSFVIAPVEAGGSMVYWATKGSGNEITATKLVGFAVGDEGTVDALLPTQIQESGFVNETGAPLAIEGAGQGKVTCIGCHSSTPDGKAVAFNGNWPWPGVLASVEEESVGERPSYVTDAAATTLKMPFIGTFTFSKAAWSETAGGRAVGVIQQPDYGEGWQIWNGTTRNIVTSAELVWFDLGASAEVTTGGTSVSAQRGVLWDFIERTGDTRAVANPVWSNDGSTIVYASCDQVAGGHAGGLGQDAKTPLTTTTECDIFKVPYNGGDGGAAEPVAAEPGKAEYYPDFSYDDALIAYTRAPVATGYHYYRTDGEIWVTAAAGGDPVRLAANDPPSNSAACPSEQSPGVLNSWPKWSPSGERDGQGNHYYWLIFSSGRSYPEQFDLSPDEWTPVGLDRRSSQLYLAAVVIDPSGNMTTYPASYIWNQTTDTANLTPAWDEFKIPAVIVR